MSNPIALFDDLREMYLRYLDSPFDLRYPDLITERRNLLDIDERLYRRPLIEPVSAYRTSGMPFQPAAAAMLGGGWPANLVSDLTAFVSQGLFPVARELYLHQRQVFE